jgi:hypothetical protein
VPLVAKTPCPTVRGFLDGFGQYNLLDVHFIILHAWLLTKCHFAIICIVSKISYRSSLKVDGRDNIRHHDLVLIITSGSVSLLRHLPTNCLSKDHGCSKSVAVAAGSVSVGVLAFPVPQVSAHLTRSKLGRYKRWACNRP